METNEQEKNSFRVFFSYGTTGNKTVYYLLQLNETLYVVQRLTLEERSDIQVERRIDHIIDYRVVDEDSTGHPTVVVHKLDGSQESLDFSSGEPSKEESSSHSNELAKKTALLTHQNQMQKSLHQRLIQEIAKNLKYEPANEGSVPSECLVRYGDCWKRIHNDHLVIGVPLLNASSR